MDEPQGPRPYDPVTNNTAASRARRRLTFQLPPADVDLHPQQAKRLPPLVELVPEPEV